MPVISSDKAEEEGILRAAELMAIAARTAPKARGVDAINTSIIYGDDMEIIAAKMEEIADRTGMAFFRRDANCLRRSKAVLLIGVMGSEPRGLNCGACGFPTCDEFRHYRSEKAYKGLLRGPNCVMALLDLGIAIGSAVKVAADLNVDNRVMFTIGVAALELGLMDADVAIGIPLSATGKNIFFDRKG